MLMYKQVETSRLGMELVASLSMAEPSPTRTSNVSTLLSPCVQCPSCLQHHIGEELTPWVCNVQ